MKAIGSWLGAIVLALVAYGNPVIAQTSRVEDVVFAGNVLPGSQTIRPIELKAKLYLPPARSGLLSAVVISPSSGGVQREIDVFYAEQLVQAGIAALSVDSFASRGLKNSIYDQAVLSPWQSENDAVGALKWLASDARFRRDRIGVTGVSKGGAAALLTAIEIRRQWTRMAPFAFAAHVPIVPPCYWLNRSLKTTGAPIFFMLAELDDQTPASQCVDYARRLTEAGNSKIEVRVYPKANHAWEVTAGKPAYFDARAENHSKCIAMVENDGSSTAADGTKIAGGRENEWAKHACMTLGTHCCGGTEEQRQRGARDMISFLKKHGF
jgi:dienelactone hydrolase